MPTRTGLLIASDHILSKMAISPYPNSILLLSTTTLLFVSLATATPKPEDLVAELLSLQSKSESGVIHLDDHSISRFLTSTKPPRPYSLLIFFDAHHIHHKIQDLHREFSLLASSFIANNPNKSSTSHAKLFFCEIELKESKSSFTLFGVNALPHIRLVGPNVRNPKESDAMNPRDFPGMAESMSNFVQSRTKLSVGPIHHPPILSKNQVAFAITVFLIWLPFMMNKILSGQTLLHDPKTWLGGAVLVYFFSVSGGMYNIIRKVPMFLVDGNKVILFYEGSGMQLGAEGFAIGFLYTIVGVLLALVTHVAVMVKDVRLQRLIVVISLVISFWAVNKVIHLDSWKTGYGVHTFWPSSWK